jgi:hypothetical protein
VHVRAEVAIWAEKDRDGGGERGASCVTKGREEGWRGDRVSLFAE